MLHIGCHLSSSKGFAAMGRQALELGADTFQFFTRNPRGSKAKDLDPADAAALVSLLAEHRFAPIIAHAPYTLNLCGAEEANRQFARETMADDLRRLDHIPGQYYNFHPGSHVGQGTEAGIAHIADGLNAILRPDQATTVLLETMAGKGSEVGGRFEELREILDRVELSEKMGVCLDTCHVSDAGYDLIGDLDGVLTEFDRVIGLDRLKALHLNDSKNPAGARKDRHERIGEGCIGLEALTRVVRHPALRDLPFCLETPNELPGYAAEIALMRRQAEA
jgi:deoxyribonuclease-4